MVQFRSSTKQTIWHTEKYCYFQLYVYTLQIALQTLTLEIPITLQMYLTLQIAFADVYKLDKILTIQFVHLH